MTNFIKNASFFFAPAIKKAKKKLALDDKGEVSMEVILGILVSIVLIAIVLSVLNTSVSGWMTQITTKFGKILGGDFT